MFSAMKNIFKQAIKKIILKVELHKYDNFTIAEYFRKQGAQIGEGCYIVPRVLGTEPYLVKIGNHVAITRGVHFHTHDGGTWIFRQEIPGLRVFGPIIIEDNCLIGEGVHLLPNVTIGTNSIIGANSVVISDIPPNSIAIGIPARRFGAVEKYKEKCIERWNIQCPPDYPAEANQHYEKVKDLDRLFLQLRKQLCHVFSDKIK